jgi:hypothetical protein
VNIESIPCSAVVGNDSNDMCSVMATNINSALSQQAATDMDYEFAVSARAIDEFDPNQPLMTLAEVTRLVDEWYN